MSIASEPKHCPKCQTPLPGDAPQGLCPKCLLAAAAVPTESGQPAPDKTPPSLAELAAAFPQLEILELIGQGGMGFVFKARQPKLDRFVALKILPQSLAADPAFAERFSREGRVLAKLNHPNIVTIHDFGVASGRAGSPLPAEREDEHERRARSDAPNPAQFYYLLMEFVDGVNLRQAMRAGRFTPDQALAIVPKICEALQFAHNEGILHRDIKPENILLDAKGRVKIADFGIAKLVAAVCDRRDSTEDDLRRSQTAATENLTEAGKTLGTPNYMAPEQRECSGEVDQRADIYSLGVVFYEMLTGELPLGRFAPPSQKSAADPRVDEVVLRALEKEKAKRYASADEVRTQVETIAATPGSAGVPPAEPGVAPGSRKTNLEERADGATPSAARGTRALPEPRFSRTAIVGACWAVFPFIMIARILMAYLIPPSTLTSSPLWRAITLLNYEVLGLSGFFGTTILGWIAVSQIRRSAGKLYGIWLAVFDGLLFPLLAMNGLAIWTVWAALRLLIRDSSHASGSTALVILFSLPVAISLNRYIIRRVWRAVNQGGEIIPSAPTEPARKNSTGKMIAIGCGVVAAVGLIILLLMALVMYLSYAPPPSSARLKEQQNAPTSAVFHRRVFETDAKHVNELIPAGQRRAVVVPADDVALQGGNASGVESSGDFSVSTRGEKLTDAQAAEISPATLDALLASLPEKPGVLTDDTREVASVWWRPGLADGWSYSRSDFDAVQGSGGGNGCLGFRHKDGRDEIRIADRVTHSLDVAGRGTVDLCSRLFYEGKIPSSGTLAFLVPFFRKDDSAHYLVVVYEIASPNSAATPAAPPQLSFGPVIERVVSRTDGDEKGFAFVSLKSGRTFKPPFALLLRADHRDAFPELTPELRAWIQTNDVDVLLHLEDQRWNMETLDALRVRADSWEQLDSQRAAVDELTRLWNGVQNGQASLAPVFMGGLPYSDKFGVCEVIRTRGGETLVWQWAGLNTNPRGVKLRYKLVQPVQK